MADAVLTIESAIQCPHGGRALLVTSNGRVMATGAALLETDIHMIVGCPFTVGPDYSPCVTIEWSAGAVRVTVGGVAVLTEASIGMCMNPESAPQGLALVASTQEAASAT